MILNEIQNNLEALGDVTGRVLRWLGPQKADNFGPHRLFTRTPVLRFTDAYVATIDNALVYRRDAQLKPVGVMAEGPFVEGGQAGLFHALNRPVVSAWYKAYIRTPYFTVTALARKDRRFAWAWRLEPCVASSSTLPLVMFYFVADAAKNKLLLVNREHTIATEGLSGYAGDHFAVVRFGKDRVNANVEFELTLDYSQTSSGYYQETVIRYTKHYSDPFGNPVNVYPYYYTTSEQFTRIVGPYLKTVSVRTVINQEGGSTASSTTETSIPPPAPDTQDEVVILSSRVAVVQNHQKQLRYTLSIAGFAVDDVDSPLVSVVLSRA